MLAAVDRHRLGRLHRKLRHRACRTQEDHALECGVSARKIMKLEAGDIAGLRFGEIDRSFSALGADVEIGARYGGAAADRLLDERHAGLLGQSVRVVRAHGWTAVEVEVTFSHFGERGSIDLLAWHESARALLVKEIKSEVGAMDGTLRPFDVKSRLARRIARERYGWDPLIIGRILVLPEERTARRAVQRHAALLDATLPARSRELRTWLRQPVGNIAGIWFMTEPERGGQRRNPSSIQRVRKPRRPGPGAAG